jgi:hypothetical protein
MKLTRYQANGFIPVSEPPARRNALAATVTIVKGDMLQDNGSGYMTNAGTAFAATHMGVAAIGVVGDSSSKYVEYYPLDTKTQYSVPVAANAVITRDAIGSIVDLEANDDIDISDTVSEGIGFMIDDIDISADAIAANTYGYAIGHFVVVGTEA